MDTWQTVMVAIAAGLALVATALFTGIRDYVETWFKSVNRRVKKKTYTQQVERLARFLETFDSIKTIKEVDRCLIFHGHNCGGLPTPGKIYTIKAVHGWTNRPEKGDPIKQYNFEVQVDLHYVRMLEDVIKIGRSIQVTSAMPDDCKLRSNFEFEGVKSAIVFYLGLIDDVMVFLSAASYTAEFGHAVSGRIQLEVDRMRSIMEEE